MSEANEHRCTFCGNPVSAPLPSDFVSLRAERDSLRAERDAARDELGVICVATTLGPGEALACEQTTAACIAVQRVLIERDELKRRLDGLMSARLCGEFALLTCERDKLRTERDAALKVVEVARELALMLPAKGMLAASLKAFDERDGVTSDDRRPEADELIVDADFAEYAEEFAPTAPGEGDDR